MKEQTEKIREQPQGSLIGMRLARQRRQQAKSATAHMSEAEVTDLIDQAVQWAREH